METKQNETSEEQNGISIEDLKKVSCLKALNDEQLQEALSLIKNFTLIAFEVFESSENTTPIIQMNANKTRAA